RGALDKVSVDEVGLHMAALVEQLEAGKVIGDDIKIVAVAIAEDTTTKTQALKERHGEFQENILGVDIHAICANPAPRARANHWHQVARHITALFRAATKAPITDFHAVMQAQEVIGSKVPESAS